MIVLGLSFDFHDAAAAILVDGEVVAAAQEERFSRVKHDSSFPKNAIRFCLRHAEVKPGQIDRVAYYEDPLAKFDRILWAAESDPPRYQGHLLSVTADWFRRRKFEVCERIAEMLGIDRESVVLIGHHDSHMAAAFYCSPFERATIVTMDAVGEYETAAWGVGEGTQITRIGSVSLPHSLGLFYSAFTTYLGFEVNEGEYKVMGMAGYGRPRFRDELIELFRLHDDGGFELDQRHFDFLMSVDRLYRPSLVDWLGPPRDPEEPFVLVPSGATAASDIERRCQRYADIAASVQSCAEHVILHLVRRAVESTGIRDVCLAGGVALNSVANSRLLRELGIRLYVQPAAGDAGSAIGAGAVVHHRSPGARRMTPLGSAYLGSTFTDDQVDTSIRRAGLGNGLEVLPWDILASRVADILTNEQVVGWFQGRAEWGPRALGNRSILASPLRETMREKVNQRIKFRELFRPFAPMVPIECIHEFFECQTDLHVGAPERFMLTVHRVRPDKTSVIPAVTHVDGTARVQVVDRASQPLLHALLLEFGRRTGVPVLLNTSFNLRGEPIVDSPDDALRTFMFSGLDILVLANRLVRKEFRL